MASRAILRRRNTVIHSYVNGSFSSVRYLEHAVATTTPPIPCKHGTTPYKDLWNRFGLGKFGSAVPRESFSGFNAPIGVRWLTQPAAAKNHEQEENDEAVAKKRKEASPEECDQAVEGLTTAKAKAMAKRSQESQKEVQSVLRRVWTAFLGIGPALRAVASMSREDWAKKLVHWKGEFVSTLQHYWLGSKLLWADVRISSRLLLKLAGGKSLSRRERQQLTRTTADIFRLVPFAVFIIVPFMEFLLPVFLKLFPNMLPSTFQDKMKEQEALKRRLKARIEYARFLQDTVKEMAKEVQNSRSGELKKTAEDLDEFLNMVRRGAIVSNEEILGFAKLFNDELTLDNISRPRLVNMCKYMGISPFGTDAYLRYMLRKHLRRIKEDDKLIQAEGVNSLSEAELREDCRERGMLGLFSVEEMRQQLRDWLDLSLNHSVPSSLLILSRSFTVSGKLKPEEAVQATLSSLPDEVVDTIQVTSLPSGDSVSERRRKLEFLEMQEELIKEEEERQEVVQSRMESSSSSQEDKALKEMNISTAKEAHQLARDRAVENKEQLCEISRALAVLASASSVSTEREDFLRLVNKEIELYNSMVKGSDGEKDAFKAYKAARNDFERSKAFTKKIIAKMGTPQPPKRSDRTIFLLNTQNRVDGFTKWSINNVSLTLPPTPYLGSIKFKLNDAFDQTPPPVTFPQDYDIFNPPVNPNSTIGNGVYKFNLNEVVDVILQNANQLSGNGSEIHPWHLHGHDFWVLGYGEGKFKQGDEKKFNLTHAPLRNTAVIFPYGWTALRFKADNPGVWAFHCHIEPHLHMGMGVIFAEGVHKVGKIPREALTCGLTGKKLVENGH